MSHGFYLVATTAATTIIVQSYYVPEKAELPSPNKKQNLAHVGSYPNYGHFLGPLNTRCRIMLRNQKRTIILTKTSSRPPSRPNRELTQALLVAGGGRVGLLLL